MTSKPDNGSLTGKFALISGGSSGIGAATARLLAQHGATVAIGYHSGEDRAEALARELPGAGHITVHLPLSDQQAHAAAFDALRSAFGRLDFIVHSAGFTQRIPHRDLETLNVDLFNEILTGNAGGTYSITRSLLPLMTRSSDSAVIVISSVSATTGMGSNIAYCAAKAAQDTMMRSFARAFGPIRFLSVSPSSVDTGFVAGRDRKELEEIAAGIPLGRVTAPEDVANAVLAAAALLRTATGTTLVVDGGHTL